MANETRDTYETVIMKPAAGGAPIDSSDGQTKKENPLKKGFKIFCTVMTWGFFFYGGWTTALQWHHPDYSMIQVELANEGREKDGAVLSEIGRVCQNDSKTPYSCKTLFDSLKQAKELAQK